MSEAERSVDVPVVTFPAVTIADVGPERFKKIGAENPSVAKFSDCDEKSMLAAKNGELSSRFREISASDLRPSGASVF